MKKPTKLQPLTKPKTLSEAVALVKECRKVLDDVSHGLGGAGLAKEAKTAFDIVIKAAQKNKKVK
jgi:hypothetical protein